MTLPIPLSVRLVTSRADRHITADLHDLSFRTVVPGGFASARMSLNRPLATQPDEIAYYGRVIIYDERNGNTVWEGRLEDPGRTAGSDGELWEIAATGPSAHAHDRTEPLVYVDHTHNQWVISSLNAHYIDVSYTEDANETPVVQITPREAVTWVQNQRGATIYRRLIDSDQKLARITFHWDTGSTTTNNTLEMFANTEGDLITSDLAASATYNVAGGTLTGVVVTNFDNGRNIAQMIGRRNGPNELIAAGSNAWLIVDPIIRAMLKSKSGADVTTGYTTDGIRAHEVVADLLGRWLNQYDGANASIATNTYDIDQLAFDETDAAGVFDELMGFHPDHYWQALESNPTTGKHRFEWRAWPTTVRYEADVTDGFDSPGSAVDLFNQVYTQWKGAWGLTRKLRRTISVPLLTAAGLTRTGFIKVENAGSSANAIQQGDEFLADHAIPSNAGRLEVARPILDRDRGTMVQPWEIRPGHLIRVRGVLPTTDALNVTARDGVTVFKVTAVDYDTASASAVLELDSQPVTLAHLLARGNAPVTARRR